MFWSRKCGILAGLLLVAVTPARAQEQPNPEPSVIGGGATIAKHRLDPDRVAALRAFVELGMAELSVPGLAVAVVDRGEVVLEAGYGVRALGRADPVDAHTLFMIGSNTKSLVTLMMARLVDEKKLRWDEPAARVYPALRLRDPRLTEKLLVRHLVCACAGLPRKDMPWILGVPAEAEAGLVFDRLALSSPTSGIGEAYGYSNLMAAAGGYLAGSVAYPDMEIGAAFDRAMDELVFRPLGMNDTTFDMERATAGNFASPHGAGLDASIRLATLAPNQVIVPYRPAGGAWSSAHDMIRYLALEASEGLLPSGDRLVSAANLLVRRTPSVRVSPTATYGLGFVTDTSWEVPIVRHAGSIAGYRSEVTIFPDAQVAAVILANSGEGGLLLGPVMRRLYELLYDAPSTAEAELKAASASNAQRVAAMRAAVAVPVDPNIRERLVQNYWNDELGSLRVERIGPVVKLHFPLWSSEIGSRANADGTISLALIDPTVSGFELLLRRKGEQDVVVARDGTTEYEYVPASTTLGKADASTK
jgi:CubicO group peptidase (beta-lactamase class C family)